VAGSSRAERLSQSEVDQARASVHMPSFLAAAGVALKKEGPLWKGICPFHSEKTPSFTVWPDHYSCFGCGIHGDAISWLMQVEKLEFRDAIVRLIGERGGAARFQADMVAAQQAAAAEPDTRDDDIRDSARAMWFAAKPIGGTLAEVYLRSRGIRAALPQTLRFDPECWHKETKRCWPAMLAAIQDGSGTIIAVQRTWLSVDGSSKAPVRSGAPKKTLGKQFSGAVRLFPVPRDLLGLAEGVETAFSAAQRYNAPVWATLGSNRMPKVALPPHVKRLLIFADRGGIAADKQVIDARRHFDSLGLQVRVILPPEGYKDFNDWDLGKRMKAEPGADAPALPASVRVLEAAL